MHVPRATMIGVPSQPRFLAIRFTCTGSRKNADAGDPGRDADEHALGQAADAAAIPGR